MIRIVFAVKDFNNFLSNESKMLRMRKLAAVLKADITTIIGTDSETHKKNLLELSKNGYKIIGLGLTASDRVKCLGLDVHLMYLDPELENIVNTCNWLAGEKIPLFYRHETIIDRLLKEI